MLDDKVLKAVLAHSWYLTAGTGNMAGAVFPFWKERECIKLKCLVNNYINFLLPTLISKKKISGLSDLWGEQHPQVRIVWTVGISFKAPWNEQVFGQLRNFIWAFLRGFLFISLWNSRYSDLPHKMRKKFQHLHIVAGIVDFFFFCFVSLQVWKTGFVSKMQIPLIKQKLFLCCTLMHLINSPKLNKSRCLLVFYVTVLRQLINMFCFVRAAFCSDAPSSSVVFSCVSAAFHCRWSCTTHKTKQNPLLHFSLGVKGSNSQWRKFFDIYLSVFRQKSGKGKAKGSCEWDLLVLGRRFCSASVPKSAFPAGSQRELWKILPQKGGCAVGRGGNHCKSQTAKPLCDCKTSAGFPSSPSGW